MSHSQNDRIAERNHAHCAAYGCPMLGTMSMSTTGSNDWYCWLHFGREATQWQRITTELRRFDWLIEAMQEMRRNYGFDGWDEAYLGAMKAIRLHQRLDLEYLKPEPVGQWFARLDKVLQEACAGIARDFLSMPQQQSETWSKVGFEAPAAA